MSSMYNQAAVEALCSATYLSNYLDSLENLPDDLQRAVTQMRELDAQCNELLNDIDVHYDNYQNDDLDNTATKRALLQIQRLLVRNQEIGDEKLQLVSEMVELIEGRRHQLEQDLENLDPQINEDPVQPVHNVPIKIAAPIVKKEAKKVEKVEKVFQAEIIPHKDESFTSTPTQKTEKLAQKRQRRKVQQEVVVVKEEEKPRIEDEKPKKKKKRKIKQKEKEDIKSANIEPIDPDEPTYCLCDQISYGEMIGCDNDQCEIEWFHFQCVNLTTKPKGKWFCPNCRGETSKIKKHT